MANTRRAVVIGTGAGGLATAAYLAKSGFDVLGLEQGEQFGGWLAPFRRGEFVFSPGVHYVPSCRPGQLVHDTLAGVGIDAQALFSELDPDGFDVYRFPDLEVRMCRGLDSYRERLSFMFPDSASDLTRFFDILKRFRDVGEAMQALRARSARPSLVWALPKLPSVLRWSSGTFGALLHATVHDPRLRAVLAAAGGDYGLPPGRASALAGVSLLLAYSDGAFYPRGGSGALRDALVRAAERQGARFRTHARVEKIETRDGRATSVVLADGERIEADVIVSDADPTLTLGRLLDADVLPDGIRHKVRATEPSLATFAVYLGMRRDLRAHGMGRFDVWSYPQFDLDALYAPLFDGRLPDAPMLFLSPNSLKDETSQLAAMGSSTLEIVTFAPHALFERWRDRPLGARGAEYEAEKSRIADWILEHVDKRFPDLVGDVVVREVSTPLSNESYTLAVRGGAYGPALTPEQSGPRRFGIRTPLPNLFLAGAGVFGDGVAPCLLSGRVAARAAERAMAPRRAARPRLRPAHA